MVIRLKIDPETSHMQNKQSKPLLSWEQVSQMIHQLG
jgi:hypothetical protein